MECFMSRLSIELTPEQHNAIKAMALLEGQSIKDFVWKLVEPKLEKHRQKSKKIKGYGAGHKDCPLCQQYENARNGRYNKKTERRIAQSMKEVKSGKAMRFKNVEDAIAELRS